MKVNMYLKQYDVKEVNYSWQSVIEVRSMAFEPKTIAVEVSILMVLVKN